MSSGNNILFAREVEEILSDGQKLSRLQAEKIAKGYGLSSKTKIKELVELAVVNHARRLARKNVSEKKRFDSIVELYERQPSLSHRDSTSVALNQYSTSIPMGFVMGLYCRMENPNRLGFEPSAGNGALTIVGHPEQFIVNELDPFRAKNLESVFPVVHQLDASKMFPKQFDRSFDAVIMNPPFGILDKVVDYDGFKIKSLDHQMTLNALEAMKDDGKAAIIFGGHTRFDSRGRIQKGEGRYFLNYLYHHYYVDDLIQINSSKLYAKQGTQFKLRLILINGRKKTPSGAAPLKQYSNTSIVQTFDDLYTRVQENLGSMKQTDIAYMEQWAEQLLNDGLGAPYIPASDACIVLNTQVPDSMAFEMHSAVNRIKEDVGGDIDNFVRHRLGYKTKTQLCKVLSAEQIDAVAMCIYNIEALGQATIIGDQTGIGKGRIAASMIRYGVHHGIKTIFLTEKANLFSDMYRDLKAIGSSHLRPFIVNSKESKTDIKDEHGKVIYSAPDKIEQDEYIDDMSIPEQYNFIVATYSQFNSPKKPKKRMFLGKQSKGALVIMDESHNASGLSNTGQFMQEILHNSNGAVFLSATFAKRPDNMPIYAMKTAISEANMSQDALVSAITNGGVALQEILASQLVAEGQMIRRERTYEGVTVNYTTLTRKAQEHKAIADNITGIIRDIIAFQSDHINQRVNQIDEILAAQGEEASITAGTQKAGADNLPYFSKVFNIINQMLFSIKADSVAEMAIEKLKQGKKPLIAFSSTMGSFIEQMENVHGGQVGIGDTVKADFAIVLEKGLEGVMRYTTTGIDGAKTFEVFKVSELSPEAQIEFARINKNIREIATGITISPIDVIVQKINEAGYSTAEVTGRKLKLQLNLNSGMGVIQNRKAINAFDAFREFNDNEIDVLLINQSGSTGASAHAVVTDKVPAVDVKPRVMIVLQPELDINLEIQKRGRIHRTGQMLLPEYDYVNSAIPAEQRLMMMLQKKLKSLDANTSSNQKQSNDILDVPDFLNKYGDQVVKDYLSENPEINELLGDPINLGSPSQEIKDGAAHKVSGRVAVLSTKQQEEFYTDIKERYDSLIDYLKQTGDYDLEVEELALESVTLSSVILKVGKGGNTNFGENSILEKCEVNNLRKPFSATELENLVQQSLASQSPSDVTQNLINDYVDYSTNRLELDTKQLAKKYDRMIQNIGLDDKVNKASKIGPIDLDAKRRELESTKQKAITDQGIVSRNRSNFVLGLFKFFEIGKAVNYPVSSFDGSLTKQMAVFLGFQIDKDKANPYAPSAMKLRFAIASSQKYLAIPASFEKDILAIKGASIGIHDRPFLDILNDWETTVKENSKNRGIRYIVTGNILQAFAEVNGKLVSYTTKQKDVVKGILLPDYWNPQKELGSKVTVPVLVAQKIIRSMTVGSIVLASHLMSFTKVNDDLWKIFVPSSKAKGGDIYLDENLLKYVKGKNFEKVGSEMQAQIESSNLTKALEVLQEKGVSVTISQNLMDEVGLVFSTARKRVTIVAPPKEQAITKTDILIMEMEAEAILIELQLLNLENLAA